MSRFAAYKTHAATRNIQKSVRRDGDTQKGKDVLHAFDRYQAAEYNTTITRCRTAKQFEEFNDRSRRQMFANLRWLPSRSADRREEHIRFYNRVWPKDDPFWNSNQPGNLWNCKCDWEETRDPVTDNNPTTELSSRGLRGNPATTGEIFSDDASYFRHEIEIGEEAKGKIANLEWLTTTDTRDWRLDYYTDNGGLLRTSRERIALGDKSNAERAKFAKEHAMCAELAEFGKRIDYLPDVVGGYDITLDGIPCDLKQTKSTNNISKKSYEAITKQGAKIVVWKFEKFNRNFIAALKSATDKWGIHGYWYVEGVKKLHRF